MFLTRRRPDFGRSQIDSPGQPFVVHQSNRSGVWIKAQHAVDDRRFGSRPDNGVESWIYVSARRSASERNPKNYLIWAAGRGSTGNARRRLPFALTGGNDKR